MIDETEAERDERLMERARRIHGSNPFSREAMARDGRLEGLERSAVPVERRIAAIKQQQDDDRLED